MNNPSIQQQAIFKAVSELSFKSLLIIAVAGAGKTSTLVEALKLMQGRVAFAAFNRKIVNEIKEKVTRQNTFINTFHGHAGSAWRSVAPKARLDEQKQRQINADLNVPMELDSLVTKLSRLAKLRAVGIETKINDINAYQEIIEHYGLEDELADSNGEVPKNADELLNQAIDLSIKSLKAAAAMAYEVIDFNDQLWVPCYLNAKFWQYDWVLVDEAQDSNPIFRVIAKRLLKVGGRMIFVGDPRQAINGFAGADNDALEIIKKSFGAVELPLTVSYRCPKEVVKHAQQWVKHIQAAESAISGSVETISLANFENNFASLNQSDAIICRNTKPLVELAYQLIKNRIACHVEGRDIGQGLLKLATRWKAIKNVRILAEKLIDWKVKQETKLLAQGKEVLAQSIADKVETLIVIIDSLPAGSQVSDLRQAIETLFQDGSDTLTLSTIHKSKGREWERVYLLGRNRYQPSPYARQQWQAEQEDNLIYVAITRAKRDLIEIIVPKKERS